MSQDELVSQRTLSHKKKGQDSSLVNVKCITVILDMFIQSRVKSLCHRKGKVISLKWEEGTTIREKPLVKHSPTPSYKSYPFRTQLALLPGTDMKLYAQLCLLLLPLQKKNVLILGG